MHCNVYGTYVCMCMPSPGGTAKRAMGNMRLLVKCCLVRATTTMMAALKVAVIITTKTRLVAQNRVVVE